MHLCLHQGGEGTWRAEISGAERYRNRERGSLPADYAEGLPLYYYHITLGHSVRVCRNARLLSFCHVERSEAKLKHLTQYIVRPSDCATWHPSGAGTWQILAACSSSLRAKLSFRVNKIWLAVAYITWTWEGMKGNISDMGYKNLQTCNLAVPLHAHTRA